MKSPEKDVKSQGKVSRKSYEKSNNEILKLKELPNERLEGSWGALWLGIRTFFGFKLSVVVLPRISTFGKPNANMKTFGKSNATEKCSRNPFSLVNDPKKKDQKIIPAKEP